MWLDKGLGYKGSYPATYCTYCKERDIFLLKTTDSWFLEQTDGNAGSETILSHRCLTLCLFTTGSILTWVGDVFSATENPQMCLLSMGSKVVTPCGALDVVLHVKNPLSTRRIV